MAAADPNPEERTLFGVAGVAGLAVATACVLAGCANFRHLNSDLLFMETTYIVSATVENADAFKDVYGMTVEWDRGKSKVLSGDVTKVGHLGVFAFFVRSASNQYLMAFSDSNGNKRYDAGEPSWFFPDAQGQATPVSIPADKRSVSVLGRLSASVVLPAELIAAGQKFLGGRTPEQAATGWNIPIALGDIADLDDPRFSSVRGEQGLWEPASFPRDTGVGIYFLEPYDAKRTPVLFVYGAAGSPQDWRTFFSTIDRKKYQPWFYLYPSGRRLDSSARALNYGVELLHDRFGFERLYVVAHSMGGLVSKSFLIKNVLDDRNGYITKFVSISTPWGGHEAAAMGVKYSPAVVPSWIDMAEGSDIQKSLQAKPLKGRIDHLLLYGTHGKNSLVMPDENDGTVSVKSQLNPAIRADAVRVIGYDATHVGILSRPDVIHTVEEFLAGELPPEQPKP